MAATPAYPKNVLEPPRSLYLHVPFCPHICPYCDFHKMKRHKGLVDRYLDQLERDLDDAGATWGGPLDTLYLGGGTPSHLTDAELTRLMDAVTRHFDLTPALEVTLEADPGTFDAARAAWFKDLGITRLSIGVQSTQVESLATLGRTHTPDGALQAIAFGQAAGLAVSADLMTAVPQQDAGVDATTLVASGVNHLSVYTLTIEPGTPFALRGMTVSEDRAQADDQAVRGVLRRAGFERYEVSNWAQPGFEAVHNRRYWTGDSYLGLGPSAASLLPGGTHGVRHVVPTIKDWLLGRPAEVTLRSASDAQFEALLTGLRTREGVDLDGLETITGAPLPIFWDARLREDEHAGRIRREGTHIRATETGLDLLNAMLERYVP